jgi:DNA primase
MSPKGELLKKHLEERGVQLRDREGWQKIRCAYPERHPRGDRVPSATVNLGRGWYRCWSCGLEGSVYDIVMKVEGLTYAQALTSLGGVRKPAKVEETWL